MKSIEIYTRPGCGYCSSAKRLLTTRGVAFTEYNTAMNSQYLSDMQNRTNGRTFPQVFIDNESIGGFEELFKLDQTSGLNH